MHRAQRASARSSPPNRQALAFAAIRKSTNPSFFDGFAHGLKDVDHPSNILRLFNAHEETKDERGIYKMYYDGMGRDLANQTVGTGKKVASDKFLKGPAKAVADDIRKRAMNDAGDKGLRTRARSAILEGTAAAGTTAKNNIKDSFSLKRWASAGELCGRAAAGNDGGGGCAARSRLSGGRGGC
ncbi:hypothetical protein [Burkholderia sp. LA-2-3-30-S1-D2]|uniref:hypothetical protein n=1 Tax=Burkholderia sp. LA-2-3-30-S1-D2 TaxID=1637862 RepID=UPI00131F223B|nr:hypothetical protein [Burkholderia sp. LA-2-3-30-S1-D2]